MLSNENNRIRNPVEPQSIRNVLIVDDSRLQREILARSLRKWGYRVVEAESAEQALLLCASASFDLVLSDWMMPGMNGLDFCCAYRNLPNEEYGYFILLTSKSEKVEIARGLDAGADDFLTKPVNQSELRARITAGDRIIAMQRELSDKNRMIGETLDKLQVAYDSIDADLVQARKIQQSMVPDRTRKFGNSHVSLLLKPCGHIGGDMVGMFAPNPDQVGFYSLDVSGHGITSAMMTARLGGYFSPSYFDQNLGIAHLGDQTRALREPEDVAKMLNERQVADTGIDEYYTLAYGTIDLPSGRLKLVQAGHPHPLVLRRDGSVEFVGQGGIPIGLIENVDYTIYETDFEPGDRLLLYSDGFTECRLSNGEMLDADGLLMLIDKCKAGHSGNGVFGPEFLDDLFWNLVQVMNTSKGMEDDVSAALIEYDISCGQP